ncbi:hypothetical protein [Pseudomonas phage D6]|nr:hypothetical protein [Pseudomonas phage D6]
MFGGSMSVVQEAAIVLTALGAIWTVGITLVSLLQQDRKKAKAILDWWYTVPLALFGSWCALWLMNQFSVSPLKWIWQ